MVKKYLKDSKYADHIRIGVGLILHSKDKLILEKRVDCKNWGLTGGGVEVGETIEDAATRECYEETSIKLKKEKLKLLGVYSDVNQCRIINYPDSCFHAIDVIFCYQIDQEVNIKKSEESFDVRFFKINSLPNNIVPPALKPIEDFKNLSLMYNDSIKTM